MDMLDRISRINVVFRVTSVPGAFPAVAAMLFAAASTAFAQPCNNLITPNFGTNGVVRAAVEYDGHLIIGGSFTMAGNNTANRLARWNGSAWEEFAGGTNGAVHGLAIHQGDMLVSGFFTEAGGVPCHNIARWDGEQWHPFGAAQNPVSIVHSHGDGVVGYVRMNTVVHRWDGSEWTVIGTASGGSFFIFSMIVYEGDVYVGGFFQAMNGVPTVGVARWDGNDWHPVGGGLSIGVWSLAEHDGELYAGGIFSQSGGMPITRVARWDGVSGGWNSMGSGPPMSNASALGSYGGHLVAAGSLSTNGVLARWNGISWEQLGGNFSTANPDHAIVVSGTNGILMVGGNHANESFVQFWQNCASACCVNGACVPLTMDECAAVGGTFFGTGFGCGDVVCDPAAPTCAGDLTGDGNVGVSDLLLLLSQWGPCP